MTAPFFYLGCIVKTRHVITENIKISYYKRMFFIDIYFQRCDIIHVYFAIPTTGNWKRVTYFRVHFKFVFSEREHKFTFAICHRPSVCRLSVCLSSVTLVHPTQAIEIFGNISTPCGTLAIHDLCIKILPRSSQENPSVGGVKHKRGSQI